MALDFRSSQFRGAKFISSGSTGTGAKLVFYDINADSTSNPNNGVIDATKFNTSSIGTDIFLYVSGGIGQRGTANAQSISVFGGDLVISGNLFLSGTSNIAGNTLWQSTGSNQAFTTGSILVSSSINALSGNQSITFETGSIGFRVNNAEVLNISPTAISSTLPILSAAGTAAAPGFAFQVQPGLGFYRFAADVIGHGIGGSLYTIFRATSIEFNQQMSLLAGATNANLPIQGNITTSTNAAVALGNRQLLAGAGVAQLGVQLSHTINQTGASSFTALDINTIQTATGSGQQLAIDVRTSSSIGTTEVFSVSSQGNVSLTGSIIALSGNQSITFATSSIGFRANSAEKFNISPTGVTSSVPILVPAGGTSAPSVKFTTDTSTGLYSLGSGFTGFSSAGADSAAIGNSSGNAYFQGRVGEATFTTAINNSAVTLRASNGTGVAAAIKLTNGLTATHTTGTPPFVSLTQTYSQSSTAGYTFIQGIATETATGSGVKLLMDLQAGSTPNTKFSITNTGDLTTSGSAYISGTLYALTTASFGTPSATTLPSDVVAYFSGTLNKAPQGVGQRNTVFATDTVFSGTILLRSSTANPMNFIIGPTGQGGVIFSGSQIDVTTPSGISLGNFAGNSLTSIPQADVYFFSSGAIGGKDGSSKKVALVGGDLVVSGNFYGINSASFSSTVVVPTPTTGTAAANRDYVDYPSYRLVTGSTDTLLTTDFGKTIAYTLSSSILITVSTSLGVGFPANKEAFIVLQFEHSASAPVLSSSGGATINSLTTAYTASVGCGLLSLGTRDGTNFFR